MSTGLDFVNITPKRVMGSQDFGDRFLDALRTTIQEVTQDIFVKDVVINTELGLSGDGNDKFKVDGASRATDGAGHLLDIANSGFDSGIQFENTLGITYDIALHFAEIASGIQINPRTGNPEFIAFQEAVGESADPDTVVDNGSTLTLGVDSVTEVGVDNTGRTVRVWKKVPGENASTEAVAIEDVVVAFVASKNVIQTAAQFGQVSASVVRTDYTVVLLGPSVKRNTGLLNEPGFVFLGDVLGVGTGSPPTVFDTSGQDVFSFSFSDISDITRVEALSGRVKIQVTAVPADVNTDQIRVRDPSANVVFAVDGNGIMTIANSDPQIRLNDTDTAALAGFWRTRIVGDAYQLEHNTDVTTPFDTFAVEVKFEPDLVTILAELNVGDDLIVGDDIQVGEDIFPEFSDTSKLGAPTVHFDESYIDQLSLGNSTAAFSGNADTLFISKTAVTPSGSSTHSAINSFLQPSSSLGTMSTLVGYESLVQSNHGSPQVLSSGAGIDVTFEHISNGGVELIQGLKVTAQNNGTGTVDVLFGARITTGGSGSALITDQVGLVIEDVSGASNSNFALATGAGDVGFGGDVFMNSDLSLDGVVQGDMEFADNVVPEFNETGRLGIQTQRWEELHTRFAAIGNVNVSFILDRNTLVVNSDGLTPSVTTTTAITSVLSTGTANPIGTGNVTGYLATVDTNHAGGTVTNLKGMNVTANHTGTGSVTNQFGINVSVSRGAGVVGTMKGIAIFLGGSTGVTDAIGLDIGDVTVGSGSNFAIRTGDGIVQHGDDVQPEFDESINLGTSSLRWDNLNAFHARLGPDAFSVSDGDMIAAQWLALSATSTPIGMNLGIQGATGAAGGGEWKGINLFIEPRHTSGTVVSAIAVDVIANAVNGGITTDLMGMRIRGGSVSGALVGNYKGIEINGPSAGGTITTAVGLDIASITAGASNFALRTASGVVEFGDDVLPDLNATVNLGISTKSWLEFHSRFASVGNAVVSFPDSDEVLVLRNLSVAPTAQITNIDSSLITGTGEISGGGPVIGFLNNVATRHLGDLSVATGLELNLTHDAVTGVITDQIGIDVNVTRIGTGIIVNQKGIRINLGSTGANVVDAIGLEIGDLDPGVVPRKAIKTGIGIVEFGDTVQPASSSIAIGTATDRWGEIFCAKVRDDAVPLAQVFESSIHDFPTVWANAVIAGIGISGRGGMLAILGVFTVPDDGVYRISYTVPFTDASTPPTSTPSVVQARIRINGSTTPVQSLSEAGITDADQRDAITASFQVQLNAGDTVALQLQHRNINDTTPSPAGAIAQYPNTDSGLLVSLQFNIEAVSITN